MFWRHDQSQPRIAIVYDESLQVLTLGGKIHAVVEISRYNISAAANDGLERLRAALEVHHIDRNSRLFEFAELLCKDSGQIAQAAPTADGDRYFGLSKCETARQHERTKHRN